MSLPIPAQQDFSDTSYASLNLGDHVATASGGRIGPDSLCHHDPMFVERENGLGEWHFGQCDTSQSHLRNQGVGIGDVFLFFGWFTGDGYPDHHRIFGYMEVEGMVDLARCDDATRKPYLALKHPHALGMHDKNDMIYSGRGALARTAAESLCLTDKGFPRSVWKRPDWLEPGGLSYFGSSAANWPPGQLTRVGNGQEFVADIGERPEPREWLDTIIEAIRAS